MTERNLVIHKPKISFLKYSWLHWRLLNIMVFTRVLILEIITCTDSHSPCYLHIHQCMYISTPPTHTCITYTYIDIHTYTTYIPTPIPTNSRPIHTYNYTFICHMRAHTHTHTEFYHQWFEKYFFLVYLGVSLMISSWTIYILTQIPWLWLFLEHTFEWSILLFCLLSFQRTYWKGWNAGSMFNSTYCSDKEPKLGFHHPPSCEQLTNECDPPPWGSFALSGLLGHLHL